MISIYEFIYKKLSNSPAIASQVKQITPAVIKNMNGIPAITYNRIWEHRTWIARIGNYQISIRAAKLEQAEEIADIVVDLFSGLKESPVRSCTLTGVNQGYYKEERLHGIHISLRFKLVDEHF